MRLEDWCHQAMFHMWESLGFGSTYAVAMWKKCQVINQLSLHNFGRPQNHLLPPWMTTQTTPSYTNRRIDKHSFMNKNPATKNIPPNKNFTSTSPPSLHQKSPLCCFTGGFIFILTPHPPNSALRCSVFWASQASQFMYQSPHISMTQCIEPGPARGFVGVGGWGFG